MAFALKPITELTLPLIIKVPNGVGKTDKADLVVTWEYIDEDERKAFYKESAASYELYQKQRTEFINGKRKKQPKEPISDLQHCKQRIKNIRGLLDSNGEEIEYKPELLDLIFKWDYAAESFCKALQEVISGEAVRKILEKN